MERQGIDLYLQPNADPHMSEYQPEHWKCIAWATGFTGEAATFVLTQQEAFVWTDSRFFVQATHQLAGTGVGLMRAGLPETPTIGQYIARCRPQCIGYDGRLVSVRDAERYFGEAAAAGCTTQKSDVDLTERLWEDRPALPHGRMEIYSEAYAGEATRPRLDRISAALQGQGDALLLTRLDDVAWAFNLRGTDIHCTPVCTAFALIGKGGDVVCIDRKQQDDEAIRALAQAGVRVADYTDIYAEIRRRTEAGLRIVANVEDLSVDLRRGLPDEHWTPTGNPIPVFRSVKNETEMAGYRSAMVKDGVALTRFYRRLEQYLREGKTVTELDCVDWLIEFRREQALYREESFDAIVAWGGHAAMPHYFSTPESNVAIEGDGLLLIDTGGQYQDGTTDITRTVAIGTPTSEMCADYTRVLKGHIRLAQACFPEGTRGDQLDALARMDLWQCGKTYRHGTSHGVGHCLCVHEGPESVRMEHNPQVLLQDMVLSNEPAVYLEGAYGIRHENCVAVRPFMETADGRFYRLETLTLFPIDTTPIVRTMLTADELQWLNDYHQTVYQQLAPHLNEEEKAWLRMKTAPIA
jgi:Xaa-Pro aminopeptidase